MKPDETRLNSEMEIRLASGPTRVVEPDGRECDVFLLPSDPARLEELFRDLFQNHWSEIVFGPLIEGAAWEMRPAHPPTHIGMTDGYLTIAFGVPHFDICIGVPKGSPHDPVPASVAQGRKTSRAELYRLLAPTGAPVSWGIRLFNGKGEQQINILLGNPFVDPQTDRVLKSPDWSRLALWDYLRARWFGLTEPDDFDRSGRVTLYDIFANDDS
jgi:hypothetical protein